MIDLLTTKTSEYMVILAPSVTEFDPRVGVRTVEKAKVIQFRNWRAQIPDDWLPLLEAHEVFTGSPMQGKTVYLADDALGVPESSGPAANRGAITAGVRRRASEPPFPEWEALGVRELIARIERGDARDLDAALAWERDHKSRRTVLAAIAMAMAGQEVDHVPDPELVVEDVFSAPVPEGV